MKLILLSLFFYGVGVFAESTVLFQPISSPGLLLKQAKLLEPIEPDVDINFTIWFKLKHQKQLDQLVNEIYDPHSTNYHKFLTHDQFTLNYAPDPLSERIVTDYFTEQGINAKLVNHRLQLVATAQQVEQLLHVRFNRYRYQKQIFFANTTNPRLPTQLAQHVSAITGLNNLPHYFPAFVNLHDSKQNAAELKKTHQVDSFSAEANGAATTKSQSGFLGNNIQKSYDIAHIAPVNGMMIDGTDQTIVIVDACGQNTPEQIFDDANLYNSTSGIQLLSKDHFAVVDQHGAPYLSANCKEPDKAGWGQEIALDVEAAHTLAPGANIVLVLVSSSDDIDDALADLTDQIAANNFTIAGFPNAYVISNSWAGVEYPHSALNNVLEQAAAEGLSLIFASGDSGDNIERYGELSVLYPASSQYATAVGGTSLFVGKQWDYAFETGWGTASVGGTFFYGSGGGISRYYPAPSWQDSIGALIAGGYDQGTIASYKGRALPDVAMLGDPSTGLYIFERHRCLFWCRTGGTSLATPLFSATLALVNQARALSLGKQSPVGFMAPTLYHSFSTLTGANALNIISPPNQLVPGAQQVKNAPKSVFASKGVVFNWDSSLSIIDGQFWNDVTGVGSPNIPNFIETMMTL